MSLQNVISLVKQQIIKCIDIQFYAGLNHISHFA